MYISVTLTWVYIIEGRDHVLDTSLSWIEPNMANAQLTFVKANLNSVYLSIKRIDTARKKKQLERNDTNMFY